ncbi:Flagellar basal body-associated protein FliL [Pirellulimonas nuda]|uniref:Flagellar protein FliL n=2 Tax=Pirellulimonas nuda TaxID=2528009 RepID=A0A518D9V3_9BACT|nr:Flagellar basal body-associated protein FliL [Pirellulimonas nuda]
MHVQKRVQPRGGFVKLLIPIGIVSALVVVELVAAAVLMPTAQQTDAVARELAAARAGKEADNTSELADGVSGEDLREVELGKIPVTRYNPENDTTLNIDLELYAVVLADDEALMKQRLESNASRVKEQIILTLLSSNTADLSDPGLGLIKRRISDKVNRALGRTLVREVLVTKFNFVER